MTQNPSINKNRSSKSSLLRYSLSGSRQSKVSFFTKHSDNVSEFSETESEEKSECPWDLIVNIDENDLKSREECHLSQKQIMMLEFVNGPEEKVAVWRPPDNKTSKDLEKMPLAIRAAFIEDMVASRFCKWLRGLGGRSPNIDEKSLKELFQIGIVNPTSSSIRAICEERTFIPDLVAEKLNLPEKTLLKQLQRHIQWDIWAEAQPKNIMAFGKFLDPADQFRPPNNRTRETWLACDSIPEDMERFSELTSKSIMELR